MLLKFIKVSFSLCYMMQLHSVMKSKLGILNNLLLDLILPAQYLSTTEENW